MKMMENLKRIKRKLERETKRPCRTPARHRLRRKTAVKIKPKREVNRYQMDKYMQSIEAAYISLRPQDIVKYDTEWSHHDLNN